MRPARGGGPPKPATYTPKIELLYKSPDRYPNALEASKEGLWVGDQVSERINLLDWETGKVLQDFVGEAHNTSGLAVGGGFIWIGCNGAGTASNLREFKRPFDKSYGEIVKLDMKGKQVKGYRTPWGGVHGTVLQPADRQAMGGRAGSGISGGDGSERRPAHRAHAADSPERAARARFL